MEVSVQAVVDEAIRYEHNLAALYQLFSSSLPDDAEFWWELSISEEQHAGLLKASQRLFGEEFARETLPADLELLRASNRSLEETIDRFKQDAPGPEDAFRTAFGLEGDANEATLHRLLEIDPADPAKEVVDRIQREEATHVEQIREYAGRKGLSL
jgi:hypothetical protein